MHEYVLLIQFTHLRLENLHNHIIIRYIGKSLQSLYHYILAKNSLVIIEYIPIKHYANPTQSYNNVYLNITSSLSTTNHN